MKATNNRGRRDCLLGAIAISFGLSVGVAFAGQSGDFNYEVIVLNMTNQVAITQYVGTGGGVAIPSQIDGMPVGQISDFAFLSCTGLASVVIPTSVTSLGNQVFGNCSGLTNITVDSDNAFYCDQDGVLFNRSKSMLLQYPGGRAGSYTVPESVVDIAGGAFAGCAGLNGIVLPSALQNIRASTFSGCSSLSSIILPDKVEHIASSAFYACSGLTQVQFGRGLVGVQGSAFDRCTQLGELVFPEGLLRLNASAFYGCVGVKNIVLPSTVTNCDYAFTQCSGLTNISVAAGNAFYSDIDGVLCNQAKTALIQFPAGRTGSYSVPVGVERIEAQAFANCAGITQVFLPAEVNEVNAFAFMNCTNLISLAVAKENPSFRGVDGVLFNQSLTRLVRYPSGKLGAYTVPQSVTMLEARAFADCVGLANIVIPDGLVEVGYGAFMGCAGISTIYLGSQVNTLGGYAFGDCTALTGVFFWGQAPVAGIELFAGGVKATVYYREGTSGWSDTFGGMPTAIWNPTFGQWAEASGLVSKYPDKCGEADDADQDGMTNLQEMLAGTSPADAHSTLAFESAARPEALSSEDQTPLAPGQFALFFAAVPGKTYDILEAASMNGSWQVAATVAANARQKRVVMSATENCKFFRVVLHQP